MRQLLRTAWLVFAACLCVMQAAVAQQIPPNIDPSLLEQLSPEQRESLMRTLGIGGTTAAPYPPTEPETFIRPIPEPLETGEEEDLEPRLEPGSTVIIRLEFPVELTPEGEVVDPTPQELRERDELLKEQPRLAEFMGAATYEVGQDGSVNFPGLASVYLAGLTAEEAASRLEAEPALRSFEAEVIYLPLTPVGAEALEPFGYSVFEGVPTTFAPATDVPVPVDYVIGPGDEVRVQLFGNQNAEYSLYVSRDGTLDFPGIGPMSVAGLRFDELKELIDARVEQQMIGVRASTTLGQLRSIRVFVLGDVERPGSFTVSGLSSVTNALFASGGVSEQGSLRDIQLKRDGQLVKRLDLYDLLLSGDNSADARLQPNDVIFVGPLGPTVAVGGEVRRPAIYELRGEATLEQVVALAGGVLPTAYTPRIRVERIGRDFQRAMVTYDLDLDGDREIRPGDTVHVDPLPTRVDGAVRLTGYVERPGTYGWHAGMRLSDLLPSTQMLRPGADPRYVLIRRQPSPTADVTALSADLAEALGGRDGENDPVLVQGDEVHVFELGVGRRAFVDPLLDALRLQAVHGEPAQEVTVGGMVRAPGVYPLEPGMRVSDLIRAGANLTDAAYALDAEITRYAFDSTGLRTVEVEDVNLSAVLAGDEAADILLRPFDYLHVKEIARWKERGTVEIAGEVRFPGTYPIEQGETLGQLIERAGGLTPFAFPTGSVFLREDLREREREQLQRLANRLERDLLSLSLQATRSGVGATAAGAESSVSIGQSLLDQLRQAEPLGRLVIDLPAVIADRRGRDVILRDGDTLFVPSLTQEVTVIGEVQYSTSHIHRDELARDDYLALSGGLTANADEERIYIVRANGAVVATGGSSKWFRRTGARDVLAGDTIVVPIDVDRVPTLALWQSATSILYNLAIAAAAVGSF